MLLTPAPGLGMDLGGHWGLLLSYFSFWAFREKAFVSVLCEHWWKWGQMRPVWETGMEPKLGCDSRLYILLLDRVHRHMCGATLSHWGDCLAHGFTKPSPCSHRSHQLPAMSLHSTEAAFFLPFSSTAAQESVAQYEMHQSCVRHKSQTSVGRSGTEKPSVKALEKYWHF